MVAFTSSIRMYHALSLLLVGSLSCAQNSGAPLPAEGSPAPASETVSASAAAVRPGTSEEGESVPKEKFSDGRRAFQTLLEAMQKEYYAEGLSEDDWYRAASRGLLERADPSMRKWNKLLSPSELAFLSTDLTGEVVGIGVVIHFERETGWADVLNVIPGSTAEKAGLLEGDKIVSVGGKVYKGMALGDVVSDIRGKVGENVTVTALRGDKLIPFTVTRAAIQYDPVSSLSFEGGIVQVHMRTFNAKTHAALRAALETGLQKGMRGLVLDLRGNQGGLFDAAVQVAGLLMPAETPLVRISRRGGREETVRAKGEPLVAKLPLVVLVNHETASGAELLAGALQEQRQAMVVGTKTLGKWSVQTVRELGNGYGAKFTTGLIHTPKGRTFDGSGLIPDVEVGMEDKQFDKARNMSDSVKRLTLDPQLRTAINLLRSKL